MPDAPGNNDRVTVAILKTEMQHLRAEIRQYAENTEKAIERRERECGERHSDHEQRIRDLEGAGRNSIYRDVGVFLTALAAGVTGALKQ